MEWATPELARAERAAKLRFLDEYDVSPRARWALKRAASDAARTKLKHIVADKTLRARDPMLTARSLREAARIEPSLWWSPWSAVLLASVWYKRLFDAAVARRTRR